MPDTASNGSQWEPLLPELVDNLLNATTPQGAGWQPVPPAKFTEIKEWGKLLKRSSGSVGLDAIPDIWARPLMFMEQLRSGDFTAIGAFRGVLALLALRNRLNCAVRATPVDLQKSRGLSASVLGKLPPPRVSLPTTSWNHIYLIEVAGHVVAITSPLTILFPVSGFDWTRGAPPPWWDKKAKRFRDPQSLFVRDRYDLAKWVEELKQQVDVMCLAEQAATHNDAAADLNVIADVLQKFKTDLATDRTIFPVKPSELDVYPLPNLVTPYDQLIGRGLVSHQNGQEDLSNLRIRGARGLDGKQTVYVLPLGGGTFWGMPPDQITLVGHHTLTYLEAAQEKLANDDVLRHKGAVERRNFWREHDVALNDGQEIWIDDDFFTKRLSLLPSKENAFAGALLPAGADQLYDRNHHRVWPILPIEPALLGYFSGETVAKLISFQPEDGGIIVRIRVPVTGRAAAKDEGPKDSVQVQHFYSWSETFSEVASPVLEVWPNFKHDAWTTYFVFWHLGGEQKVFEVKPQSQYEAYERDCKVWRLTTSPEYLECYYKDELLGIILVNLPSLMRDQISQPQWRIGVDFGTSSTHIYVYKGAGNPQRLEMTAGSWSVTSKEAAQWKRAIYRRFLPPPETQEEKRLPFLSFFRVRSGLQAVEGAPVPPVLGGHTFFYERELNAEELAAGTSRILSNLKWSINKPIQRAYASAFVKQVALHAAAEAFRQGAAGLEFRYAVPMSYTSGERGLAQGIWDELAEEVRGYLSAWLPLLADPTCWNETAAGAEFFEQKGYLGSGTALCLDIGGGSSDLSVWFGKNIRRQASLRFAGRDILLGPLFQYRGRLAKFLVSDASKCGDNDRERFFRIVEAQLRDEGWRGQGPLLELSHSYHPDLRGLFQTIALAICGLFYYCGIILRSCLSSEHLETSEPPKLYVGGNGSRLLDWLPKGYWGPDPLNDLLYNSMFLKAAHLGNRQGTSIQRSAAPKEEVAYGLVSREHIPNEITPADTSALIAGEVFLSRDGQGGDAWTQHESTDTVPEEFFKEGLIRLRQRASKPPEFDLPELEAFLKLYNSFATSPDLYHEGKGVLGPVDAEAPKSAARRVDQWLNGRPDAAEPLFIFALKELVKNAFAYR